MKAKKGKVKVMLTRFKVMTNKKDVKDQDIEVYSRGRDHDEYLFIGTVQDIKLKID